MASSGQPPALESLKYPADKPPLAGVVARSDAKVKKMQVHLMELALSWDHARFLVEKVFAELEWKAAQKARKGKERSA